MEAELLDAVDGLVVTSRELARKQRTSCPLLHLPHGVDFEHFHQARFGPPAPAFEGSPRPVVGFFGLLSEWFDAELVGHLADCFPDVSFVLIGQAHLDPAPLTRRANVRHLGWVPYADLPRLAAGFDVGLIPYVENRWTRSLNPLKLMEYFALGLPVLATRLPELEGAPGPLHLARTREEFRAGLRAALGAGPGAAAEAIAVARRNTWQARAEQLSGFLEGLCGTRRTSGPLVRKQTTEPVVLRRRARRGDSRCAR
jgi:glycosyltransferase involved in cell wall biosynthesis